MDSFFSEVSHDLARKLNGKKCGLLSKTARYTFWMLFRPEIHAVIIYRINHRLIKIPGISFIAKILWMISIWFTNCDIDPRAKIGGGFLIAHPIGVVIGGDVEIGYNVTVLQNVTLGGDIERKMPIIESNVVIWSGAVVFGDIVVGKDSHIGANAVVFKNVPANMLAVGVPAVNKAKESQE